jgi:ABC-type uncharacterized transport system involved in gliding motility auxiliary subunit
MEAKWLKARQTRYTAYATVYILVVLAVLAAANWLANRHNKSVDTTSNKRYSLSDQTIKIVKNLKEDVTIMLFDESRSYQQAKDLLDRYDNLSPKLTVQYIDPLKKPQLAREMGVRMMGTVLVKRGDKREEARSVSEEEITSALVRVLKTGTSTVCFVAGAGEPSLDETGPTGYSGVKDALEKNNYRTQTVNLLEKPEIPQDCTIVAVAGPRYDYPQPVVDALKKYVEGGGRALFMMPPPLDAGKDRISPNEALLKTLAEWGVTLNKDQVLDTSGIGGLYGLGPEVALASKYDTHPIVREMKGTATAFAIVRSLEAKPGDKTSVERIVSTSDNSFATTQLTGASRKIDTSKGEMKSYAVAAAGEYRTGQENKTGRFVVVGSADWVANYVFRFAGNRDLFLNMMNWLSSDEDLISIRPKDPEDRRITVSRSQMMMLRTTSQFLIPLAVIVAGVLVWWRRR